MIAAAIISEIGVSAIRFYFLYKRMQMLNGMTEEEAEAKFQALKTEYDKRDPAELEKLLASLE